MSKLCCYIPFRQTSESDDTCARTTPFADNNDKSRAIFIGGNKIKKVNSAKFLGVIIDEQLKNILQKTSLINWCNKQNWKFSSASSSNSTSETRWLITQKYF